MTARGENIMAMTAQERRNFIAKHITKPTVDAGWQAVLDARERVFLSLCTLHGAAAVALRSMIRMDGFDPVSGETFDLGDWAAINLNSDEPERLYAGLLMDPKCEAFHRLALQAFINGSGAARAVAALVNIMGDEKAKASARVGAARVMVDMASMLSKVGVEQVETMRQRRDAAGRFDALPAPEALSQAEETLRRLREMQNALPKPEEPTAEDLME